MNLFSALGTDGGSGVETVACVPIAGDLSVNGFAVENSFAKGADEQEESLSMAKIVMHSECSPGGMMRMCINIVGPELYPNLPEAFSGAA